MNMCATCQHWRLDRDDEYNDIIFPPRPDRDYEQISDEAEVARVFGHRVRRCRAPKLLFYERPAIDGACVIDGSEYRAELLTGEAFGCVLHEALP